MKYYVVLAAGLASAISSAQVVLSGPGLYNQNFDSLASSGTGLGFSNNLPTALMPGWYSTQSTYDADNGSVPNSGQYSYGSIGSGERALGSTALPGALIRYGMRLNNASGGTFTSLNLSYTGEQWRDGSTNLDKLTFEYSSSATSLFSGNWTPLTALDFNSVSNTGAGILDGNLPANESFQSSTITGLNWLNGTDMWVRWTHIGNTSRHALALDNMQLNAVSTPEPASIAAVGLGIFAIIRGRRRRR